MAVDLDIFGNDEFESVRNVLGVSPMDVTDVQLATVEFGWQAERLVKEAISNWQAQLDDPENGNIVRLAAIYACAGLVAEQYAQGGTLGNVEGGDARERDWDDFSELMWGYHQRYLDQLKQDEGIVTASGLTFLNRADDLRAVRELLGPELDSITEETIVNTTFGQHAELLIKEAIQNWPDQWDGQAVDPLNVPAEWVEGTAVDITLDPDSPPGSGGGSLLFSWSNLLDSDTSDSEYILDTPVDLTAFESDFALTLWADYQGDPLARLVFRVEFLAGAYMEWDITPDVAGWQRRELSATRPTYSNGLIDWANLTAVHVIATGAATPGADGALRLRNLGAINYDTLASFRLAAIYGTAALLGESYASNSAAGKARRDDWDDFAEQMWGYQALYLGKLEERDTEPETYLLTGMVIASRRHPAKHPWYNSYPPVWAIDWDPAASGPRS
jgi:hypothetical protein